MAEMRTVKVKWHHWGPSGYSCLYEVEGAKDGTPIALHLQDFGFDVLHGSVFKVTVEQVKAGETIPNPWHKKCACCGRRAAGHERNCCPLRTGGFRYFCDDCWGENGTLHYALYHPRRYAQHAEDINLYDRRWVAPSLAEAKKAAVETLKKLKAQRKERGF